MKILARDITLKNYLCKEEIWNKLFELSGIIQYSTQSDNVISIVSQSSDVVEYALKVLFNMTKNFYLTIPATL